MGVDLLKEASNQADVEREQKGAMYHAAAGKKLFLFD
jgi:hypothetical protein